MTQMHDLTLKESCSLIGGIWTMILFLAECGRSSVALSPNAGVETSSPNQINSHTLRWKELFLDGLWSKVNLLDFRKPES